jgi:hypothetical protein
MLWREDGNWGWTAQPPEARVIGSSRTTVVAHIVVHVCGTEYRLSTKILPADRLAMPRKKKQKKR